MGSRLYFRRLQSPTRYEDRLMGKVASTYDIADYRRADRRKPSPSERVLSTARVSLVIPCFNESEVLPLLFERVRKAADSWGARYEVILVDDGSKDDTWELIGQCHGRDPRW